jgi:hypothetical protein
MDPAESRFLPAARQVVTAGGPGHGSSAKEAHARRTHRSPARPSDHEAGLNHPRCRVPQFARAGPGPIGAACRRSTGGRSTIASASPAFRSTTRPSVPGVTSANLSPPERERDLGRRALSQLSNCEDTLFGRRRCREVRGSAQQREGTLSLLLCRRKVGAGRGLLGPLFLVSRLSHADFRRDLALLTLGVACRPLAFEDRANGTGTTSRPGEAEQWSRPLPGGWGGSGRAGLLVVPVGVPVGVSGEPERSLGVAAFDGSHGAGLAPQRRDLCQRPTRVFGV